ncbi:MAG: LysM peptidoglycan-binding domain-containing protein [Clostridia bacterium]|nr:LysM peptidoglycan-binding domain-containing protein [Clostridia bacterium]MBQ4608767.1 LysM peptidoglycan-binding domain-containing protein [Clostridia bacterium]MBQ6859922.1 LysM peptidoglycan-binding domain-containing protein [Clostridia bacterium]MBQ7052128.1 LysM peptidoglycan-binding domain-containing protein [Clostridia bacterium]
MEITNPINHAAADAQDLINQSALDAVDSSCPAGSQSYRVQRGDSFYLIARRFGVSVRSLMNANPTIAAGRLLVGDILCIPMGEGRSCPVGSSAYTVQPGQSVVDVMLASNVSLRALREYNEDIRLTALRPGDVLCVPPGGDRGLCENGGPVYRIQEGDTLEEIAALNGTTLEQMLRLNPNLLPSDFVAGQVICLPTRRRAQLSDMEDEG